MIPDLDIYCAAKLVIDCRAMMRSQGTSTTSFRPVLSTAWAGPALLPGAHSAPRACPHAQRAGTTAAAYAAEFVGPRSVLAVPIDQSLRRTPAGIIDKHGAAILVIVEATDVAGSVRCGACRQAQGGDQQHRNGKGFCHGSTCLTSVSTAPA